MSIEEKYRKIDLPSPFVTVYIDRATGTEDDRSMIRSHSLSFKPVSCVRKRAKKRMIQQRNMCQVWCVIMSI